MEVMSEALKLGGGLPDADELHQFNKLVLWCEAIGGIVSFPIILSNFILITLCSYTT
jgi:hypothetical protein